ncbi:MAG TPA: FAD-binding oxidoreductase, partial [Stellaceae bacterium]|nr:FAD-binding oxidoreductase [Stellaceae bacterium]
TLGLITAATLKLFPRPREIETAFLGLARVEDAMALLAKARSASGDQLTAFELIPRLGLEIARRHSPDIRDPLGSPHDWYVLLEFSSSSPRSGLRDMLETFLEATLQDGLIEDGVVASSVASARALWRLREEMVEAQKFEAAMIKHDISVPVSGVASFIKDAAAAARAAVPGIRVLAFGHVGDGNIHFNLCGDDPAMLARQDELNRLTHDIAARLGGSISAEHGIGLLKRAELPHYKSPIELALMARVKRALDPDCLLNPGKIFDSDNRGR